MVADFDALLPNHDGEDSENWSAFYYRLADARQTLRAFINLLESSDSDRAEIWENDLLP